MRTRRLLCLCSLILASLLLSACRPAIPKITADETQRIETLTAKMTPRCVGRYLIDLPEDFVLNPIHRTLLEGVEIVIEPMARERFDVRLRERQSALQNELIMGENTPSLLATMPLSDEAGYVFSRSRNQSSKVLRKLELIAFRDGYMIEVMVDARDLSQSSRVRENDPRRTDVQAKLDHLLEIYSRLRGRADNEVPAEAGVCFANGFLQGEPTDEEQVDLNYHLKTAEDVYFAFHSLSDLIQDDELLDRGRAIEAMLEMESGYTLRKGSVKGPIPSAQEWLMSKRDTDSGLLYQHFTLEANAKTGSAETPVLVVDMNVGVEIPGPVLTLEQAAVRKPLAKTTFGEAQSVALWDRTAPTLRPRPVTAPARHLTPVTIKASETSTAVVPSSAISPSSPLGVVSPNGARCPQSGTWQCAVATALGSTQRTFTVGEILPSVLVPAARSVWQTMVGAPDNEVTATTWTLTAYPEKNA